MTLVTHWHTSRRISRRRSDVLYRKLDSNLSNVDENKSSQRTVTGRHDRRYSNTRQNIVVQLYGLSAPLNWMTLTGASIETLSVRTVLSCRSSGDRDTPATQCDCEIWHVRLCRERTFFLLLGLSPQIRRESRSQRSADVSSNWTQCLTFFFVIHKFSSFVRWLHMYRPIPVLPVPLPLAPLSSLFLPLHLHYRLHCDVGNSIFVHLETLR